MSCNILSIRTSAGTALTASSTETVLDSYTLPANFLQAGKAFRVSGVIIATATNSTDTLTVKGYLGTSAMAGATLFTTGAIDAANNDVVHFNLLIVPRGTPGSDSTTVLVTGHASIVGAEGTVTQRAVYESISALNSTAAQIVNISGQWSTTNAGNSCRSDVFLVEELV